MGRFAGRTEPYCNIVTLAATPHGDVLALDGFDEPCEGSPRLPIHGIGAYALNITDGLALVWPGGLRVAGVTSPTGGVAPVDTSFTFVVP